MPINTAKCGSCKYHRPTAIFDLCSHSAATYYSAVDGYELSRKPQLHTVGHMRRQECGTEARLHKEA